MQPINLTRLLVLSMLSQLFNPQFRDLAKVFIRCLWLKPSNPNFIHHWVWQTQLLFFSPLSNSLKRLYQRLDRSLMSPPLRRAIFITVFTKREINRHEGENIFSCQKGNEEHQKRLRTEYGKKSVGRENLLNGKAQYNWPPDKDCLL